MKEMEGCERNSQFTARIQNLQSEFQSIIKEPLNVSPLQTLLVCSNMFLTTSWLGKGFKISSKLRSRIFDTGRH